MKGALAAVLLLAGCSSHTAWQASAGTPHPNPAASVQLSIQSAGGFAALVGLSILAATVTRSDVDYASGSQQRPPDMAPDRKVSEQDCTKPIDWSLGNIRCK